MQAQNVSMSANTAERMGRMLAVVTAISTFAPIIAPVIGAGLQKSREQDVGAASSLINFAFTMVGALIMAVGSIEIGDYVYSVGVSMAVWIAAAAPLWAARARKR